MTMTRQLAAIMFTDIVGYTALMGDDEEKAFALLGKNRAVQRPIIEKYNGKWIKELGDGVLSSFHTVTDAVLCAGAIQQACSSVDGLKLRIGIHLDDVIFENQDVFGDGVNIASRLQALAPIGGIWISEAVHKSVSNKKGINSKFVHEEILKNVREPVRIYEVNIEHQVWTESLLNKSASDHSKHANEKSVAVLPFVNMSNDPEQDFFGDGIAEEIINSLVHLKDLKVAGRTSSFQFKGKTIDIRELGEKLGVGNVLEGSVRKQGNRIRITAQLIKVQDGFHLWSEKYDRNVDDIFAIQEEIALSITEKLKVTLLDKDIERITKSYTSNPQAYELYLKGRFNINRRGRLILEGLKNFEEAKRIDPNYAPAYSGYADAACLAGFYSFFPAKEIFPQGKESALKAILIDPTLCEPYTSLGFYYECFEWNFVDAKKHFRKSIELSPLYPIGHSWYAMIYLSWIEANFNESHSEGWKAIKLDPLSSIAHGLQTVNYYTSGDFEEAIKIGKIGIDLDPNNYLPYKMIALSLIELHRISEAIEMIQETITKSNRYQWSIFDLIWAYSHLPDREAMQELLKELDDRSQKEYISPCNLGLAAAWMGDLDQAFAYLEKSCEDREPMLTTIRTWHNVPGNLKKDPRYHQLLRRIGFPE